jgi:hypothetical protein
MIVEVLQMSKHSHPLILIFVLFLFINIAVAETQLGSYEFYDGFENGFYDWDGILRGFPDDPKINNTIVHTGNSAMYCYSNHGVYKNIPDSSIIDAQFYYSIEYTNLHCSPSHMLSIRNNASNPEDTIVFAIIYLYTQDNEGNLPAMIEFKYLDGECKYIWNGSIPFVQWTPTEYHSVRMKLTLETNSSLNDGACNVWLDDEMIMNVSGLDTCGSIANQVAVGQLSTFSAYTFFDDVTILTNNTLTSNTLEVSEVLVIAILGVVFAVIVLFIMYKKLRKR